MEVASFPVSPFPSTKTIFAYTSLSPARGLPSPAATLSRPPVLGRLWDKPSSISPPPKVDVASFYNISSASANFSLVSKETANAPKLHFYTFVFLERPEKELLACLICEKQSSQPSPLLLSPTVTGNMGSISLSLVRKSPSFQSSLAYLPLLRRTIVQDSSRAKSGSGHPTNSHFPTVPLQQENELPRQPKGYMYPFSLPTSSSLLHIFSTSTFALFRSIKHTLALCIDHRYSIHSLCIHTCSFSHVYFSSVSTIGLLCSILLRWPSY